MASKFLNKNRGFTAPKKRKLYPQSGQALIEFALILPIVLTLALGVIEAGRYAYVGISDWKRGSRWCGLWCAEPHPVGGYHWHSECR